MHWKIVKTICTINVKNSNHSRFKYKKEKDLTFSFFINLLNLLF